MDASLEISGVFEVDFGIINDKGGAPETYSGPYQVTPTQTVQILETNGKMMKDDVTVNPIPSNYGRITWNGATLTVE